MQRHVQIATVQNCPDDKIIKITESCQKCKQLAPVENCIFIFNQLLDKLPKICVQTLNYILPPKEDLNLPFGHYVSRVFKDHSAGMMYSIDITWEPMGRQGFRFVWIFQETTFHQPSIGNVNISWHHFDIFTKELNGFLKNPDRLSTFFLKATKLQQTKL